MFFNRWRARRALVSRTPPTTLSDAPDPALTRAVTELSEALDTPFSLGDPIWHQRWEGQRQLVALDATARSVSDVRQRLARTVHELALRHMAAPGRRLLAVVRCAPEGGEGLAGWHARLWQDQGEVGVDDWRAARRSVAVLLQGPDGEHELFGGDRQLREALAAWQG